MEGELVANIPISSSADTLLSRIMSRIDDFRCPACHKLVRTFPFRCVNHHVRCRECRGDLMECPICHKEFSDERPLLVFPRKCGHENCDVIVKLGEDHEKYCGFRETKCRKCPLKVTGKNIFDHMKRKHKRTVVFPAENISIATPIKGEEQILFFTLFTVEDYFIWVKAEYKPEDKNYTHSCYVVPNGKPAGNIYFQIVFPPEDSKFMHQIMLNPDPDVDTSEENTIHVPWKSVTDYIRSTGKLKVGVYFSISL